LGKRIPERITVQQVLIDARLVSAQKPGVSIIGRIMTKIREGKKDCSPKGRMAKKEIVNASNK